MTHDELAELMSEPPGGHNHGRKRGAEGGWVLLETYAFTDGELDQFIPDPEYRSRTRYSSHAPHGTRSRYIHGRCRCEACRQANRDYFRQRRNGV